MTGRLPLVLAVTSLALAFAAGPAAAQGSPPPALYLAPEWSTAGAAIEYGPDGVLHAVTTTWDDDGQDMVVYAACRADCMAPSNWSRVDIRVPGAFRAELAVTPYGAPRLLITADSFMYIGGRDFIFAQCGAAGDFGAAAPAFGIPDACLTRSGWSFARVGNNRDGALSEYLNLNMPQRTFALSETGAPRFVFTDANFAVEPDHYGLFLMSCETNCVDARRWTETDLALHFPSRHEQFTRPVLDIGPNGSLHILSWVYAFNEDGSEAPDDIYYYECRTDCDFRDSWSRVSIVNAGSGTYPTPTWDLEVTPAGEVRAAVFVGGGPTEADLAYSLIYFWCDAGCGVSDQNWAGWVVYDEYGESPSLAIDAEGQPHLAFLSPDGLPTYATCSADCEGDAPAWDGLEFETEADMAAARPTAIPFTCDGEVWNALAPDVAVGPDGTPVVAYDVSVNARCLYQERGQPEITAIFHEIWHGTRLAEPHL